MSDIRIQIVTTCPIADIVELYKAGNWWKPNYDPKKLPTLIKNSYAFAIAVDQNINKAIGMARVISDGVSDAYIQDTIVLPKYRRQNIGTRLIQTLINYCHKNSIYWIALIAEPGSYQFYNTLDFIVMTDHIPMKYNNRDSHA